MRKCAAFGCTNYVEKDRPLGISFHRLPSDPALRQSWITNLGMDLLDSSMICSIHFTPESFVWKGNRTVLQPNSIPTLNLLPGGPSQQEDDHRYACTRYVLQSKMCYSKKFGTQSAIFACFWVSCTYSIVLKFIIHVNFHLELATMQKTSHPGRGLSWTIRMPCHHQRSSVPD